MMATERIRFKSQDEIEMERMRENLRRGKHHQNFDQEAEKRPLNAIHPVELGVTRLKLQNDLAVAKVQLERKLGHLGYLKNLEKMKSENLRDNSEECPVCKQTLGRSWALLVCGHCYCCDCIHNLVSRFGVGCQQIKCPVCRDPTHRANISYVSTRTHHDEEDGEGIEVKGSHSTKVEAVVRCLLKIRQKEPGAKCLVFSTWQEVLQIVAKALDENRVPQLFLRSQSQESCVAKFRTSTDFNILLLPVHSGANGLNLVEATHVILVEPLLNLASEQQAIGRVHRMGQKRKTTVHRFLVRGTIEERIHCFLGEHKSEEALSMEKENSLTVGQFSELFK